MDMRDESLFCGNKIASMLIYGKKTQNFKILILQNKKAYDIET